MPALGAHPFEITPEVLEKVEKLASQGMTKRQIAHCLGICEGTLYSKIKQNDEFLKALKRGKAKGIALVTEELQNLVAERNITGIIFYLKCQAGWKEAKDKPKDHQSESESLIEKLIDKL